jgi:hypothetical protein
MVERIVALRLPTVIIQEVGCASARLGGLVADILDEFA